MSRFPSVKPPWAKPMSPKPMATGKSAASAPRKASPSRARCISFCATKNDGPVAEFNIFDLPDEGQVCRRCHHRDAARYAARNRASACASIPGAWSEYPFALLPADRLLRAPWTDRDHISPPCRRGETANGWRSCRSSERPTRWVEVSASLIGFQPAGVRGARGTATPPRSSCSSSCRAAAGSLSPER